jgi:hypothetical protein
MRSCTLSSVIGTLAVGVVLAACRRSEPAERAPDAAAASDGAAVAEPVPRCRADGARLPLGGEDLVVGDSAVTNEAIFLGVVRREEGKRVASVLRVAIDLASVKALDIGPSGGDDPPPSPRVEGSAVFAAYAVKKSGVRGVSNASRELTLIRLEGASPGAVVAQAGQQADESTAFDVVWPGGATEAGAAPAAPLVAWDEDAPIAPGKYVSERGLIKVQVLGAGQKARVVSPETSDAEAPRLLARPGGAWLAWLSRRGEGDPGWAVEGPAEPRAYRWIEMISLDASGRPLGAALRVSSEKGRVTSFSMARAPGAGVVVLAVDENAGSEGAGARVVRFAVDGERVVATEVVASGVGPSGGDLVPEGGAPRWFSWTDTEDHVHLLGLDAELKPAEPATPTGPGRSTEARLDSARIVAAVGDAVYALAEPAPGAGLELRRLRCTAP